MLGIVFVKRAQALWMTQSGPERESFSVFRALAGNSVNRRCGTRRFSAARAWSGDRHRLRAAQVQAAAGHPSAGRRRQILVKLAGLFIGTAPGAQGKDLEDEDTAIQSDRQNVAGSDSLAGGIDLVLVHPDMTGCRQLLGKRAGFGDPGVPEPLVDAQAAGGSIVFRRRNYFLSLLSIFAFKAIRAAKGEFGSIGLSLGALSRRLPPSKPFWPP